MYCPKCSTNLCFCESCKSIDNSLNDNTNSELFICKGCKLTRPLVWWDSLQLDVNSDMVWPKEETVLEEIPEELTGHEAPWGD